MANNLHGNRAIIYPSTYVLGLAVDNPFVIPQLRLGADTLVIYAPHESVPKRFVQGGSIVTKFSEAT